MMFKYDTNFLKHNGLSKEEFEKKYNVKFISKKESVVMRIIGFFSRTFMYDFWTTYRLPFQKKVRITYPPDTIEPMGERYKGTREHELIHAIDMGTSWGLFKMFWLLWLIPLPIIFSGRWFFERYAYLYNLLYHGYKIDYVVDALWGGYGWAWPKCLMKKWFNKKIKEHNKEQV